MKNTITTAQSLSLDFDVDNNIEYYINDHLGGFDKFLHNPCLSKLKNVKTHIRYIIDDRLKQVYPNVCSDIKSDYTLYNQFCKYNIHPEINFTNFVCSFNGTGHVSRHLLTSILNNQGYFDPAYSSKNFSHNNDWVTGHLNALDLLESEVAVYLKFFMNNAEFNNSIYSFGHVQFQHDKNIYNLEEKLTQSFVHIVSETLATSYYPVVTEKFLYSIVTRGLFLSYAQPGWHKHIEKYYGFKLYNKIFDYEFDKIVNPVKRLIKLIEMISKFSILSSDDWQDLYLIEQDTINHNYDHYFSGNYFKYLAQFT